MAELDGGCIEGDLTVEDERDDEIDEGSLRRGDCSDVVRDELSKRKEARTGSGTGLCAELCLDGDRED